MPLNRERLIDTFLMLCRVNTPPLKEKVLVDSVQPMLEGLGLRCVRDTAHHITGGDSGNLIATLPATVAGADSIFFSCHFDTVEPTEGLVVVRDAGRISTDGTTILGADDKAGMATLIEVMRVLHESPAPHGEIQLLLSVTEETGLRGAHAMDRSLISAGLGFVLDTGPPIGTVVYTAPTQRSLDVTITGRPAHAGFEPEKGVSAIQIAARAVEQMPLGRIDFETTANVGTIAGGQATNIVCPKVKLRAEARSRNEDKLIRQVSEMRDALESAATAFGGSCSISEQKMYDTYKLVTDAPVIRLAQRAAERLGLPFRLREAGGASDANVFNQFGIPTCVLATAMQFIHTHQECVDEDDLVKGAEWVLAIIDEAVTAA